MKIVPQSAFALRTVINVPDGSAPRYHVKVRDEETGRYMYVKGCRNGQYTFTRDPISARPYSHAVAQQHVHKLYWRETA